jgi:hypothetical protein
VPGCVWLYLLRQIVMRMIITAIAAMTTAGAVTLTVTTSCLLARHAREIGCPHEVDML